MDQIISLMLRKVDLHGASLHLHCCGFHQLPLVAINVQHCPAIPRRRREATRPEKFEKFAVTNCQKFVDSFDSATRVTLTFQNLSKLSNVA